ncbi:MAG: L-threonine 3-dehydrogenase [Acidimicrobiia bacterium]|nr:L-threonine 3-dehydrogenase [Acidimicrobiia bacterium]NNK91746.1 L-threonine 3-dehydrogenase [Acidimicrobiia bacterium]
MRALVKAKAEPGLWMQEIEVPRPGDHDVLIRVKKTSICGTDLHIYRWDEWAAGTVPVPMTVGHEFMGEIVRVGADVDGLEVGMRVSGEGHVTCGHCRNCRGGRRNYCHNHISVGVTRPGAFAEYLVLPAQNVFPLPDHISDDVAAILDPLGNATHTTLAFDMVGEDVLITGAGPIGMMATAIARHIGARFIVVTDINRYRLDLAAAMGADRVIDVTAADPASVMDELGMTEGFDVGLEMSGHETAFNQLLHLMNHGGRVAVLGIPPSDVHIDLNNIIFKGLDVRGIYGRRIFETWYKMAAMLQSGLDVAPVITHTFPVDDFATGFEAVAAAQCGKVILDWS